MGHDPDCTGICEFCDKDDFEVIAVFSQRTQADRHYCTGCGNPICF